MYTESIVSGDIMGHNFPESKPAPVSGERNRVSTPGFTTVTAPGNLVLGCFPGLDPAGGGEGAGTDAVINAVTGPGGPLIATPADHPGTAATLRALAKIVGLRDAAWCRQVHGSLVFRVTAGGLVGEGDALVSAEPGLALCGFSADCPLVLAVGRGRGGRPVAGMAHASWRSTVRGITSAMVMTMIRDFDVDPGGISAAICPSAGPCCYEVGIEVRDEAVARIGDHAADFFSDDDVKPHFDLWRANTDALARAGVPAGRVITAGICTICGAPRYPSYRRDRCAERFIGLIGVRPGDRDTFPPDRPGRSPAS